MEEFQQKVREAREEIADMQLVIPTLLDALGQKFDERYGLRKATGARDLIRRVRNRAERQPFAHLALGRTLFSLMAFDVMLTSRTLDEHDALTPNFPKSADGDRSRNALLLAGKNLIELRDRFATFSSRLHELYRLESVMAMAGELPQELKDLIVLIRRERIRRGEVALEARA